MENGEGSYAQFGQVVSNRKISSGEFGTLFLS